MKIKCNGVSMKMSMGMVEGMAAMAIAPERQCDEEFVVSMVGAKLNAENADDGLYRRISFRHAGKLVIVQGQTEKDFDFLDRLAGMKLEAAPHGDCAVVLRATSHSKAAAEAGSGRYDEMSVDDMLDLAARRGLPVPRNVIKSDLAKILEIYEKDEVAAIQRARETKPQVNKVKEKRHKKSIAGGMTESRSYNKTTME